MSHHSHLRPSVDATSSSLSSSLPSSLYLIDHPRSMLEQESHYTVRDNYLSSSNSTNAVITPHDCRDICSWSYNSLTVYTNDYSDTESMSDFSIDIMDFGVSPLRNSFLSLDLSHSSEDSITSSCVNSDGFLPWQRHESGENASFLSLSSGLNSLTAIAAHERQRFNKLRGTVVSC